MKLKIASKPLMALFVAATVMIAGCQTVQPPSATGTTTPPAQGENKPADQGEKATEPATTEPAANQPARAETPKNAEK
ncbi:hypothetical protein [Paenibacillus sp. AR247]|uniref:hypothetical protein n=1 Tax=Paenibacillus sp. AR247 TaxID=1631599 RepID=UPI002157BB02|nr:hypothetical protein [Paenibacillus sp. AR247]